jgi:thiol:disulfide interchange protein DsbA
LHYSRIRPAQETASKAGRIEVVEMFFYACPHCNKLDPTIEKWAEKRAKDVDFIRVPAIIGPTWAEQAKAFYIAEALGIADEVRKKLFDSIHKDGNQYYNQYTLLTFFTEEMGVAPNRFIELYESPEIMQKASDARVKTVRYGIRGVPAIIVNGQYYTATYFIRDHDELLNVVDFLIDKVRKEQQVKK